MVKVDGFESPPYRYVERGWLKSTTPTPLRCEPMRDFSISVDIKASPERVWEVLSDGDRWHEWTPSVTSVELLDKSMEVGSRAIIRQPELPPAKFTITALEPGKSFTWSSGIPGIILVYA